MPVDTRSSSSKSTLIATSTGDKPTMDARMKSLEDANQHQSSKLDQLSQNQKSDFNNMMKQMQAMNESILHLHLSTHSTTVTTPSLAPRTVSNQTYPTTVNLPSSSQIPPPFSLANSPTTFHPPSLSTPQPSKLHSDQLHQHQFQSFVPTPSLPPYPFLNLQPNPFYLQSLPTQPNNHSSQPTPFPSQYSNRVPRLEVPQFSCKGVIGWLFQIEHFFELYATPPDQKLMLATFHLTGDALDWCFWMYSTNQITTCEEFTRDIRNHFGP